MPAYPSFSVVVAWENVKSAEADRARSMLAELIRQMRWVAPDSAARPELLLVHDAEAFAPEPLRDWIDACFGADRPADVRLIPTEGLDYYARKNAGAAEATRDVIIFLDSDVIPDPGWLEGLLDALRDPVVEVVGGATYVDPVGFYGACTATFWMFPPRDVRDGGLRSVDGFYANNVAFRRELFLAYRFPVADMSRGQCVLLSRALGRDGHAIHIQGCSRAAQPAPDGLRRLMARAYVDGYDCAQLRRRDGERQDVRAALSSFAWNMARARRNVVARFRGMRLSLAGAAAALALAMLYQGLFLAGQMRVALQHRRIPHAALTHS